MKRITVLLLAVLLALLTPLYALADLDEIENYYVTVDVRQDASADITYQVEWKVLDDASQGPLEWVKIGLANRHADNLKALTDTIRSLKVVTSDGDAYARVDLDKKYYKNEIVTFAFTLHQTYLCTLEGGTYNFKFGPGWFNDLTVKNFILRWNMQGVQSVSEGAQELDGYYFWQGTLNKGEKGVVTIKYDQTALSPATYAENSSDDDDAGVGLMVLLFFGFGAFLIYKVLRNGDHYRGGFGGPRGGRPPRGGGSCACVSSCACASHCACACACACAGGGRAGCSAKNFYGAKYDEQKLHAACEKDKSENSEG